MAEKVSTENQIRNIRRKTRRKYTAEEKIRIVLEGLQGESTIAELCRREGINQNLYYRWSKEFLEAGKTIPTCHLMLLSRLSRSWHWHLAERRWWFSFS